jgi:uncharacterized protein (TIGR02598 family)
MNPFFHQTFHHSHSRGGFSLVETTLSLGILSFGFLAATTMLSLGLNTARQARDNRTTTEIAQTFIEKAKQGTLATGTLYLNLQGTPCNSTEAAYAVQSTLLPSAASPLDKETGTAFLTRLTLQVTPLGAPDRSQIYAVVYPVPQ